MPKKVSDALSVPLNTSYKAREMTQGLRDQLLPEKISDIFSRVFTSIDAKPVVDTSQAHLAVVMKLITGKEPPVGSMPWIRNQESGSAGSQSDINNICYVASYDRVNLFNKLPSNIGNARTKQDQVLEHDLILSYVEGETVTDANLITVGSIVKIEFVNWPKEARIIAVQTKNTPFPATGENGAQNAFGDADGSTLGDYAQTSPSTRISYARQSLCKGASEIISLADQIGIPPAVVAAFRAVESGGRPSAIRFEPHLFNAKSNAKVPFTKTPGQSFSSVASETNKSAFERAYKINKRLAIESSSFGLYQVVVKNAPSIWKEPRIKDNPDNFLSIFNSNPIEISNLLVKAWFQGSTRAKGAANRLDFASLASAYNGPQYSVNRYDEKLAAAYNQAILECPEYTGTSVNTTSTFTREAVEGSTTDEDLSSPTPNSIAAVRQGNNQ
jgi:hypothetical protein